MTMEEIAKNQQLLSVLSGKNSLLDSSLKKINIFEDDTLKADLVFWMLPRSQYRKLLIRFVDVSEYSFCWKKDHIFYYVERYKFIYDSQRNFYISLDPVDENPQVSDEDQDFIFSREIIGYLLDV